MNGDDITALKAELAPMAKTLGIISVDVAVIKNEQKTHGREIGEIKKRISGVADEVKAQPERWRADIKEANAPRGDEATGAANMAAERAKVAAEKAEKASKSNWNWVKPLLPYIAVGLAAIGYYIVNKTTGPDPDALQRAIQAIERVEKQIGTEE